MAVLRFLHERQNEPATMSQIARTLRMNGSTCFNLLKTLEHERLLAYDDVTKTYSLGLHLVELASVIDHQGRIVQVALKHARPLVAEMELACLIVRHTADDEFLVVDKIESPRPIKVTVAVGQRFPANSAVLAKAYYAYQDEDEVESMLTRFGLPAYSEHSITDEAEFRQHLQLVRSQGFAQSHGEYWRDHHALAAPIFASDGRVAFLLLTVGFTFELPPEVMQSHGQLLCDAADRVTAEIGGRRPIGERLPTQT